MRLLRSKCGRNALRAAGLDGVPVFSTHEGTDEFGNVGQSLMIKCSRGHDEVQPWEGMSNEVYGNLRDKTASTMATEKIAVNFIPSFNYIYIYIYDI